MTQYQPGPITIDAEAVAHLKAYHRTLEQFCQETATHLQTLEQEWDTQPLERLFASYGQLKKQVENQLQLTQAYVETHRDLQALAAQVQRLDTELQAQNLSSTEAEAQLEQSLDCLDALADRLDGYEAQGHDIRPLSSVYEQIVLDIGQVQEFLDHN